MKTAEQSDVHFRLTASQYRQLQAIAKSLDRSVAYLLSKIVREWLEGQQQTKERRD